MVKRIYLLLSLCILAFNTAYSENVIDVLMVYTPAVEADESGADGVEALVLTAFESANEAFSGSETETRLRLVGIKKVDYVEDDEDMGTDLDKLSNQDGVMDSVLQWRSELGADLVCLIRYEWVDSTAGIAWLLNNPNGQRNSGFSVVASRSLAIGATFQHEVGHNLGAAHDRENAGDTTPLFDYAYGYRFKYGIGIEYRTLMAYQPGSLVNLFSNPDVNYRDTPIGVASGEEAADNARTIRATAPIVASYYAAVNQAPVAEAGDDVSVEDVNGNGFESVTLDGSQSQSDAGIESWKWTWGGNSESGEAIEISLPVGVSTITLEVTDENGLKAEDSLSVEVTPSQGAARIFSGGSSSYVLKENGVLLASGNNANGQLGIGSLANVQAGFSVVNLDQVKAVSAGLDHCLFLLEDGRVFGAGSNAFGQLGTYPEIDYANPTILGVDGVVSIAAGDRFSLFLLSDGSVVGAGMSPGGVLGESGVSESVAFAEVVEAGVVSLVAGGDFAAVLKEDGSVAVWGDLGDVLMEDAESALFTPVEVLGGGAISVAAGKSHLLILTDAGEVWTLGRNLNNGSLGIGQNSQTYGVTKILDAGAIEIWTTDFASYVRLGSGEVLGTGSPLINTFGELETGPHYSLVPVFAGQDFEIVGGSDYLLIKRSDGVMYGVGSSELGQLGIESLEAVLALEQLAFGYNSTEGLGNPTAHTTQLRTRVAIVDDSLVELVLDGTESSDDWYIESFEWTWSGGSSLGRRSIVNLGAGIYDVTLKVTDENGSDDVDTLQITILTFDEWLSLYFTELEIGQMLDPRLTDSDGDGLSNAEEALLGLDPSEFESKLKFEYIGRSESLMALLSGMPDDLDFVLQGSDDGTNWRSIAVKVDSLEEASLVLTWEEGETATLYRIAVLSE